MAGYFAVGLLVVAFAGVAGLSGGLAGVAIAAIWYGFGIPYAIAVGYVLLLGLFPDGIDPVSFGITGGVMVVFVCSAATGSRSWLRILGFALTMIAVLGGLAWWLLTVWTLWIAAGGGLAVLGLLAYGLHRYELVRLGLVSDERSASPSSTAGVTGDTSASRSSGRPDVGDRR
ncbi:hypothetical protein D8Y22_12425 [Salinadaptatus halalkaliphilus]|uniref:DUF8163 domain-containing protein n=1 Tax=Salinadaptatus halalkaliphilus TaxID=2419781 RepID=A0A4S3TK25_9EURY|nr:hypothetical protein D8Y22_12425 [Salinadaptatus halalkaliphilus]